MQPRSNRVLSTDGFQINLASITLFNASITLTKMSVCMTYLKLFPSRTNKFFCWTMIIYQVLWGVLTSVLYIVQCMQVILHNTNGRIFANVSLPVQFSRSGILPLPTKHASTPTNYSQQAGSSMSYLTLLFFFGLSHHCGKLNCLCHNVCI